MNPYPYITTLLLMLSWTTPVYAAAKGPQVELDRNRMVEGETVNLTLTVPGDLDGEPDFTPLDQGFDVLDRAQSSHTSIINGHMSSQRVWRLILAPKATGLLTVPPIPVGRLQSHPRTLKVLPAGSKDAGTESPRIFIEAEAAPKSPYVQGQLIYSVRIFHRVKLREASLSDPQTEGALLERLGEDKSYRAFRNGHSYNVIERRYAVFPQQSGRLGIDAPILSASVAAESQRRNSLSQRFFGRDPFAGFPDIGGFFQERRPVRIRSKRLEIEVKPRPTGISGNWLPAQSLSLEQSWTPQAAEFRVGEPVTRTLTLKARGLTHAQLPDLVMAAVDGLVRKVGRSEGRVLDDCEQALKKLTGRTFHGNGVLWRKWWREHRAAYREVLGRPPSDREAQLARQFVGGSDDADRWALLYQTLFQSLDFRFVN